MASGVSESVQRTWWWEATVAMWLVHVHEYIISFGGVGESPRSSLGTFHRHHHPLSDGGSEKWTASPGSESPPLLV